MICKEFLPVCGLPGVVLLFLWCLGQAQTLSADELSIGNSWVFQEDVSMVRKPIFISPGLGD